MFTTLFKLGYGEFLLFITCIVANDASWWILLVRTFVKFNLGQDLFFLRSLSKREKKHRKTSFLWCFFCYPEHSTAWGPERIETLFCRKCNTKDEIINQLVLLRAFLGALLCSQRINFSETAWINFLETKP